MTGRGRVPAASTALSDLERGELEGLSRRRRTAQGLARRAQIVLAAAEGLENKQIAARLGSDPTTVGKWRRRFAERRLDGLYDEPRPGAPRRIGDDSISETIRRTLEETPPDATHWPLRGMARAAGYAPSTIHRIWQAFGLQPHRSRCRPCGPASPSAAATIISGTARSRCSPRSTWRPTKSSAVATSATAPESSSSSCVRSTPRCRAISTCIC